ncbi:hypothetical protein [Nostoc punctiforme]|uniref:Uncharacterized protein n=1 Tax=Nostoc punctiforme (strain ATCC 29133 / PCC 73102) TaxID=63737 RepID=B2JB25_NOSP7|nr:hypothetical protein [Nostoc punctiforme]ACC85129.1 hypothetical protein Npun_AR274 [Nostoc punctiforme PCC 73102]
MTQSQWHLSDTKTGDTAYQATCTTSNASNAVCRPAGDFLFSAISISGCVPLAFSGVASASVAPQAVTLDCCQSSDTANPLLRPGAGSLLSFALFLQYSLLSYTCKVSLNK